MHFSNCTYNFFGKEMLFSSCYTSISFPLLPLLAKLGIAATSLNNHNSPKELAINVCFFFSFNILIFFLFLYDGPD